MRRKRERMRRELTARARDLEGVQEPMVQRCRLLERVGHLV
jgi:hypothetical protein